MFNAIELSLDRKENYRRLIEVLPYYITKEDSLISNLANLSALLDYFVDEINWVGFYLYDGKELTLGPFQGLPACTRITLGRGVCGVSAAEQKTVVVEDVRTFEGHIFCDANSLSEIVVPMIKNGVLIGVLDVDSPKVKRFSKADQKLFEEVVRALVDILD